MKVYCSCILLIVIKNCLKHKLSLLIINKWLLGFSNYLWNCQNEVFFCLIKVCYIHFFKHLQCVQYTNGSLGCRIVHILLTPHFRCNFKNCLNLLYRIIFMLFLKKLIWSYGYIITCLLQYFRMVYNNPVYSVFWPVVELL